MKSVAVLSLLVSLFCLSAFACENQSGDSQQSRNEGSNCSCSKLQYPLESLRNEDQGTVLVAYLIDVDGAVMDSKVVKSSGYPRLDKVALLGLSKCKFKPGRENGAPVRAWVEMSYVWKIN